MKITYRIKYTFTLFNALLRAPLADDRLMRNI